MPRNVSNKASEEEMHWIVALTYGGVRVPTAGCDIDVFTATENGGLKSSAS